MPLCGRAIVAQTSGMWIVAQTSGMDCADPLRLGDRAILCIDADVDFDMMLILNLNKHLKI